ncbi:HAMP domain-containing histidine kinase [Candidatus Gottesmanbacteria bacterium]|nr:HAMP domain-containing histidine kinase [Candidatus Gottesmanbacteria bacterium]
MNTVTQDKSGISDLQIELDKTKKVQEELIYKVSHELRTPITAIKGSLSTILEGFTGELPQAARDILQTAYNENDRLLRLVNNLLALSRIEGDRFTYAIKNTDIDAIIQRVIENLKMAIKEKDLFIKYEPVEKLPLVQADEDKISEVLINLIGNAIKYTQEGGVTVAISVKGEMVVVSVSDTGLGIRKEDEQYLFHKFSQVQAAYSQQAGTGLGLFVSKQIIEGHNGKIWVESSIGIGSTFFFSLPIVK